MMSNINNLIAFLVLALAGFALGGDIVANDHIKVFLFGAAAFYSEVAVDVRNDTCLSLNNNLFVLVPPLPPDCADINQGLMDPQTRCLSAVTMFGRC